MGDRADASHDESKTACECECECEQQRMTFCAPHEAEDRAGLCQACVSFTMICVEAAEAAEARHRACACFDGGVAPYGAIQPPRSCLPRSRLALVSLESWPRFALGQT